MSENREGCWIALTGGLTDCFSQQHTRVADDLDVVADVAGRSRHVVDT